MKLWKIFLKTLLEQIREWPSLSMVLVLCPFFVFLYWMMSSGGSTTYKILLFNQDKGVYLENILINEGEQVNQILQKMHYPNHIPMTKVECITDRELATEKLKNRNAAALFIIPEDFSHALYSNSGKDLIKQTAVTIIGDAANPAYTVASILALTAADQVIQRVSGIKPPVTWHEEFISGSSPRTEFEIYVPGLLSLSMMMLIFTTALALVREREGKTLRRLQLSSMNSFELLGGVSLAQIVIGTVAILLTFLSAWLLGFQSEGSFWLAIFIGVLTAGSAIAVGVLTACFCKNATAVLTIGTLPFFLFMWFTGAAMPLPRIELFSIHARSFAINDILPPTQAVIALNKVLSFDASLPDVWFEITLMLVLSIIYFIFGAIIFQKTQMQNLCNL